MAWIFFQITSTFERVTKCCNFGGFGGEEGFEFNPTLCSCRLTPILPNPQLPLLKSSSIYGFSVWLMLLIFLRKLLRWAQKKDLQIGFILWFKYTTQRIPQLPPILEAQMKKTKSLPNKIFSIPVLKTIFRWRWYISKLTILEGFDWQICIDLLYTIAQNAKRTKIIKF